MLTFPTSEWSQGIFCTPKGLNSSTLPAALLKNNINSPLTSSSLPTSSSCSENLSSLISSSDHRNIFSVVLGLNLGPQACWANTITELYLQPSFYSLRWSTLSCPALPCSLELTQASKPEAPALASCVAGTSGLCHWGWLSSPLHTVWVCMVYVCMDMCKYGNGG